MNVAALGPAARCSLFIFGVLTELVDRGWLLPLGERTAAASAMLADYDQLLASGYRPTAEETRACLVLPEWRRVFPPVWTAAHFEDLVTVLANWDDARAGLDAGDGTP